MVNTQSFPPAPKAAAGINSSRYARSRAEIINLINQMRAAGVATELDLPRVAIIGNQSVGKSSLVESISGVNLPRDSGTCTRCPFEVRLQHSEEPWYCKISLRFEVGEDGRPLDKISEISFGESLRSPQGVEAALRRAQLAILNGSVAPADWAKASDADVKKAKEGSLVLGSKKQLSFSTNLVCMDISGPDVTDLAFLDLPGIISNVDDGEDEANIDLIRNLVSKTISGNALILLCLTLRDDLENQSAMKLAKEADPDGRRTIGVLTKPDTLQEGEHERWLQVLRGERAKLVNGYFVTKQPGAADLAKNLSVQDAHEAEKNFFLSTKPWSSLTAAEQRRLGTPKLTEYLSEKLSSYITQKLPEIRQTVSSALARDEKTLASLPPPPSDDPSGELVRLFSTFRYELDAYVSGRLGYESLLQSTKFVSSTFAKNIRSTRPRFIPYDKTDSRYANTAILKEKVILIDLTEPNGNRRLCDEYSKNYKQFVLEMNVGEVRTFLETRKTRELPMNSPFGAKAALMVSTTKGWNELTLNALEAIRDPIHSTLTTLVDHHFGRYAESGLKSIVLDSIATVVENLMGDCRRSLLHLLEAESSPFTENEHYYRSSKEKTLASFTEQRRTAIDLKNPGSTAGSHLTNAIASLSAAGITGIRREDLAKLFPSDGYAEELDAMAHVVANFKVAYKRLIDNVPRYIDLDIIRKLPLTISDSFVSRIDYRNSDAAARLLAEGVDVQEERADLHKRIKRIGEAKELLGKFGKA